MLNFKVSKHDKYQKQLLNQIKDLYDSTSDNIVIKKKKSTLGEIDILAKKDNLYDIYEIKCSYRITKAKQQAKSIRKHFNKKLICKWTK